MPAEVKYIDCGYLTLRRWNTRELAEVEAEIRENGNIPRDTLAPPVQPLYDPPLICFRRRYDLHLEQSEGGGGLPEKTVAVMNKPRVCEKFRKWEQGFTPEDHIEIDLIERQEDRFNRRDISDRRWRLFELFVMGVIVTIVSVCGQIAAAFIERGSLFPEHQSSIVDRAKP